MRYYASYRGPDSKPKRKRFIKDRRESEIAYHRWVVKNYDQFSRIVANDHYAGKVNFDQSLPVIANTYIQHEKHLVRSDAALFMVPLLSGLDIELSQRLRKEILQIHQKIGFTLLYVTHNRQEAFDIGTRVVIMNQGQIEQVGSVEQIREYLKKPPENIASPS